MARLFFGVLFLLFVGAPAMAEPWLSTRYAQNCAGCHAPGRKNMKAVDRRCTLSCQGCHVNPNGGGLRSQYGKWNEDRWLKTFRADILEQPLAVAPTGKQHYGGDAKAASDDGKKKKKKKKGKKLKGPGRDGFPLVEVDNVYPPEALYLRDGREFEIVDLDDFVYQIPQQDPYRLLEQSKTDAGGDIRYLSTQYKRNDEDPQWNSFLMSADLSLRYRPIHRYVHIVYEARMQGNPSDDFTYEKQLSVAQTRSLYAMVDNLPFNTFVMGGFYRPLFGNYVPDHYALAQEMISYAMSGSTKNYNLLFNAISLGTAPNVPYLNVHVIQKKIGDPDDRTRGVAANLGMRFVTLGGSLNYSYWRTNDERPGVKTSVEMHSIGGAAKLFRTVTSLEAVSVSRDTDTTDFRQGGVYTLDTYTQLWRENYFTLMYALSNTTREVMPGESDQIKTGFKSFLIPGVEMSLLYEIRNETREDPKTKEKTEDKVTGYSSQLHLYF